MADMRLENKLFGHSNNPFKFLLKEGEINAPLENEVPSIMSANNLGLDNNPLKVVLCAHSSLKRGTINLNSFGTSTIRPRIRVIFDSPPNTISFASRPYTKQVLNLMKGNQDLINYHAPGTFDTRVAGRDYFDSVSYPLCPNHNIIFDPRSYTSAGFGLWKLGDDPEEVVMPLKLDNRNLPKKRNPDIDWQPGTKITLERLIRFYIPSSPQKNPLTSFTIYLFICRGDNDVGANLKIGTYKWHCENGTYSEIEGFMDIEGQSTQEYYSQTSDENSNSERERETKDETRESCALLKENPKIEIVCRPLRYLNIRYGGSRHKRKIKRKTRRAKKMKHTKKLKYLKKLNGIFEKKEVVS